MQASAKTRQQAPPCNTIEAYKSFKIAGIEGNLDLVKRSMTAEEIDEAERQTGQWMEAHPDQ